MPFIGCTRRSNKTLFSIKMSIKTTIKRRAERAIYLGRGERSEQYTLISHPPGTGDLISHPPGTGDLSSGLSGPGAAVIRYL